MELEEEIRFLREKGDLGGAATRALEGYGSEVFGFLAALLRSEQDAGEVFSQACEDFWVSLGSFQGRCSTRTWLYGIARHAASRFRRSPHRRPGRHRGLSELEDLAARVRTGTLVHQKTDTKARFKEIRDSLAEEDRALLVLRVDRGMPWSDIARVLGPADATDDGLARESARLRKRFQIVKDEIRSRARRQGLLSNENTGPDDATPKDFRRQPASHEPMASPKSERRTQFTESDMRRSRG